MFRSDEQLARACRALCAQVGLGGLWTPEGPTARAIELMEADGGPLSSGERIVVMTSWAVWNSHESARVADVIHRLDNKNLAAIGSLLVAVAGGMHAVDRWVLDMEQRLGLGETWPSPQLRRRPGA